MIRSLELENFKAFGERVRIPFAPITLIFGENSSGKSSILQSLNLLKQTRESRETGALLLPRAENGVVDLGSFQELLFDHDLERILSIRVETQVDEPRFSSYMLGRLRRSGYDRAAVELSFERPSIEEEVMLRHIKIYLSDPSECVASFQRRDVPIDFWRSMQTRFYVRDRRRSSLRQIRTLGCESITAEPVYWQSTFEWCQRKREDIHEALTEYRHDIQRAANKESNDSSRPPRYRVNPQKLEAAIDFYSSDFGLEAYMSRVRSPQESTVIATDGFIPVISRRYPEESVLPEEMALQETNIARSYQFEGISLNVGQIAVAAGNALEDTLERLFPMGPFRRPPQRWYTFTGSTPQDVGYQGDLLPDLLFRKPELVEEANSWLERLQIGYQLSVQSLGARSKDLFEVRLVDTRRSKGVEIGLTDVGFGISQILPFIVQSLASEGQIISIEQPEVHIHPGLQADLGDLLAEAIKKPRHNQFIIETHSEHLILRLQRLIHEKALKPTDISVIYVSRGPTSARVDQLEIDEEGDFIDEWPKGFFSERLRELRY